ncbi:phage tail protein [Lactiplantibacillus plantarum]|uniref:phage tail protein n=1 Tax=Lactiplantibacillus plantarum TaxID=1590 RepID=UPI00155A4CC1|nr:phage tail protein [Lactiplantibacillus plantarum]
MIKFHDPSGAPHFGQATITRTTSVNGGLSLTGEVFAGGDVLNGLDYGWWLNFDNEKYVITYKKLSDDTNTVVFDAVQQFFWDFAKVALHAQYTGSHEYTFYLGQLFDKSGYTYKNDVTVPAFEKENWGYKNKLDLFNDIIDQAGVEFEVHNETVHIAKQIGSDLTSFARKGINLSDLTEEMKISDFATYAKGYGAFKDAEDQSKGRLEVEYRSELAKQFGDLEMDPIVDERYTIADNLIAALKKQVDATYTVSMTMNIYDLENAGYPNYEAPKVGDWILAIDEALNFKRKIRIIQLEEQFDVTGKRIGYTVTCGDLSIVDQYTHLQSSLDSKVQRIQESVDNALSSANGKSTNYYGEKEPTSANEGDLWFDQSDSDPDKWSIKQWVNGRWEQITLNPGEVDAKVDVAKKEAETAVENSKSASDKADQLAAKYDDTNALANQALDRAIDAKNSAAGLIDDVNKASQNADDAKSIANSVNSKYTTLTDGSTMTLAELENGLAAKLTKDDLSGYATETWTQNQIKVTADGINSTLSSVKTTVDGHTTSINDLKADSSGFKAQFVTVNDTLGKQTKDIGTLQATNKSLVASFDSLSSDNAVNQHNISQLQASATTFNSTLATVQQQVTDSAVGINLLRNTKDYSDWSKCSGEGNVDPTIVRDYAFTDLIQINGLTNSGKFSASMAGGGPVYLVTGQSYTFSVYAKAHTKSGAGLGINLGLYGDYTSQMQNGSGLFITKFTNGDWYRYSVTFVAKGSGPFGGWRVLASSTDSLDDLISIYLWGLKLEKGTIATNYSNNPADDASAIAVSSISQTVDSIQTTVRGKVDNGEYQSKVTQLSNQITSVVGQVNTIGQRNLVANSRFQYDKFDGSSWTSDKASNWYSSDAKWSWWNGYQGICCNIPIANPVNTGQWNHIISRKIYVPDATSVYSASAIFNVDTVGNYAQLVLDWYDQSMKKIGYATKLVTVFGTQTLVKVENQTPPSGTAYVALHVDVNGGGHLAVIAPMLVNAASVGSYVPDNASWTEFQQTASDINLKVSKDGVINAINISPEGTSIYGNKLRITADTYIDNAVIKDAMIANLSANKLTAGSINAANINVYNINGANIVANSITADKLQAGSMLIAMNSTLQTLKVGTDGLYTTNNSGTFIGKIHANNLIEHPKDWGLHFDLSSNAQYMAWGAQNEGDPNGGYVVKFGWTRNSSAGDFTMPWGGFWFNDNVMLHKNLRFNGGGIDVDGAYQLMKFAWIQMNGIKYPFFGSSNLKAGWLFGSSETYLVRDGGIINASKILGILNGQHYKFIKDLNSNGTVKGYVDVNF